MTDGHRIGGRVVTRSGVIQGYVETAGPRIHTVTAAADSVPDQWVVPGFVDIHCHGGGGAAFPAGEEAQARAAAAFHRAHGTTTLVASLVTAPPEQLHTATERLAPLVAEGELAGIHLEGPYLSAARRGAHDEQHLREPSRRELRQLLAAGRGGVRMVTVAPELPGALEAIALLAAEGVVPAIGHTDATYEQTLDAVAAGARVATHLFNGVRPPHHRDPGPVYALLGSPGVVCEVIADGVHLHDGVLRLAAQAAGAERIALVTDAMAAAGAADGCYELGGRRVQVTDGVARIASADEAPGPLAGSTLTMEAALRRAVRAGLSMVDACRAAATTPARVLGLETEVGALAPGLRADLVVLDVDLRVHRVMRGGRWL